MAMMAQAAEGGSRAKVQGGIRLGNLYFSSGLTGRATGGKKDPLAFGGDIKEQTERILQSQQKNLEALGSSLANVLKVTVFLADVKTEKNAMNEVYGRFFPKDAPRALGRRGGIPGHGDARGDRTGRLDSGIMPCDSTDGDFC